MLNFIFNSYIKKKQFNKIEISSLSSEQLNKLYNSFSSEQEKIKYINSVNINEELQNLIYNDSKLSINDKIRLLKNVDNNPFTNLSDEELIKLIKMNEIDLTSIVSLINLNNAFDKLELLKEKSQIIESEDSLVKRQLTDFEQIIIQLIKIGELNHTEEVTRINTKELNQLLLKKDNDQYNYEKVISNPKLQELLFKRITDDYRGTPFDTYVSVDSVNMHKNREELTNEEFNMYDRILSNENFKKVFFTDENFKYRLNKNLVFDYLPKDKRYFLGLYEKPLKYNMSDIDVINEYRSDLKEKYSKYYPDMDKKTIDYLITNQSSEIFSSSKDIIFKILKENEGDSKYINKCMKLIKKINYLGMDHRDILKKIYNLNNNYPDLLNYVYYTSSIDLSFYEKVKYLLNNPKLENVDGVEQINKNSLEDLKNFSFDLETNTKDKLQVSFIGGSLNSSISNNGNHGIVVIRENGETINKIGPYHEECLNMLYNDETNSILNEYDNIEYGLSVGDFIILYENNNNVVISNNEVTEEQKESVINLVDKAPIKDKLNFMVQLKYNDDYESINNGENINAESFFEILKKIKTKSKELESTDSINKAV